jgi:hypothetical protein
MLPKIYYAIRNSGGVNVPGYLCFVYPCGPDPSGQDLLREAYPMDTGRPESQPNRRLKD